MINAARAGLVHTTCFSERRNLRCKGEICQRKVFTYFVSVSGDAFSSSSAPKRLPLFLIIRYDVWNGRDAITTWHRQMNRDILTFSRPESQNVSLFIVTSSRSLTDFAKSRTLAVDDAIRRCNPQLFLFRRLRWTLFQ